MSHGLTDDITGATSTVRDSSAHTDLTHLYTQVMCLICTHRSDSSVHTTGFWRLICTHNRVGFRGRVSGFRGGDSGWGRDDMRPAPHGNVARHSKDTSTCTLLYLETSRFRGGVSGRGFGVGFQGFGVGFRGGVVMHAPRMETWHATARTLPHAHSSIWRLHGFGVGFRGGALGWGFGVSGLGFGVGS